VVPEQTARNGRASLLIIGGAGGVGSIAIQLAKQVAGIGQVIATASRAQSVVWCKQMGADLCIDYKQGLKNGLEAVGVKEVEYILCFNDLLEHFSGIVEVIKPQGKICAIVSTKNSAPVNLSALQRKSVTFAWELMFTKAIFQTADMQTQHDLLNTCAHLCELGVLRSTLTEVLGTINARNLIEVHRRLESGTTIGKLVLSGF
ncbi:MAG: zinc-binding dehydrogenase, partial [Gammaproteobacteria bacterium]|nr:zinc-binding dehydrogenase [Gammaproteobacteria bacterium]